MKNPALFPSWHDLSAGVLAGWVFRVPTEPVNIIFPFVLIDPRSVIFSQLRSKRKAVLDRGLENSRLTGTYKEITLLIIA